MTEVELIEAMENQRPVIGITELNGGITYTRILAVIKEFDEKTGQTLLFAKLQSSKYDFTKPIVPAERIFYKES